MNTTETPANPGIHPLNNVLLLEVTPKEKRTEAGIVLPLAAQGATTRMEAVIVECGPDCKREDLKPGVMVYVGRFSCNDIQRGAKTYKLALETDILAILDDVAPTFGEPLVDPIKPY